MAWEKKHLGKFTVFLPLASLAAFVLLAGKSSESRNCLLLDVCPVS